MMLMADVSAAIEKAGVLNTLFMVMSSLSGLTDEDAARFEGGNGGRFLLGGNADRPDHSIRGDDGVTREQQSVVALN